jgi:hypothetical protein
MHDIAWVLGLTNASGGWYLLWSGIFGDVTIFAALAIFLHHRNCHARGCWRIGRHPVEGTPYVVCRRHHPDMPDEQPTAEQIGNQHRLHLKRLHLLNGRSAHGAGHQEPAEATE